MSTPDGSLELALRRLAGLIGTHGEQQAAVALSQAIASVTSEIDTAIEEHSLRRQFVHGVGPLHVAKTRNPNQYPDWSEIQNKPSGLGEGGGDDGDGFTMEEITIDARQVVSGIFNPARLPFAAHNEFAYNKIVRATDPRLQSQAYTMFSTEAFATGDLISADKRYTSGACRRADADRFDDGYAIGFVLQPWGSNELITIYPTGIVRMALPNADQDDIGKTVFLDSAVPGRIRLDPPPPPSWVQPVGSIIKVVSVGSVDILVRYEYRIWNVPRIV